MSETFVHRSRIEAPADRMFDWFLRPGAFERLAPPWENVELVRQEGGLEDGRVELRVHLGPLALPWIAQHRDFIPGRQFRDEQVKGPFAKWVHTHGVEPDGAEACFIEDRIDYALPMGALGALFGGGSVRTKLDRMMTYRHRTIADDVAAGALDQEPLRVLVSGSTGLVGSTLVPLLRTAGHEVVRLVRRAPDPEASVPEVRWDPQRGEIDEGALDGIDAVVHLAGENVAAGRWNAALKQRIRDSRVTGTDTLARAAAKAGTPVFVSASAVGIYGDRGDEWLGEDAAPGSGFLADVGRAWEAATAPAADAGARVAILRLGVVLTPGGGALAKMLPPFLAGGGGRLGSGEQHMSWVSIDDAAGALLHAVRTPTLSDAANLVAPEPVTNAEYTRTLGRVLRRPTVVPMPAFAARAAFGEMADELLLSSQRARPDRLVESGYRFRQPDVEGALRHVLGRTNGGAA